MKHIGLQSDFGYQEIKKRINEIDKIEMRCQHNLINLIQDEYEQLLTDRSYLYDTLDSHL